MKVLVLVAHADDETLGAGGIIQRFIAGGYELSVVILSDGVLTVRGVVEDNRADAVTACKRLGIEEPPVFLGFPDQKFDATPVADLANSVSALGLQPDIIVSHHDGDLNGDHRLVAEAAKIIGRPKTKPITILASEIPSTAGWNGKPFQANYYVDITDQIDTKIEAFAEYKNECMPYPHPWSREGLRILASYHGMQSGYAYAEAFHLVRGNGLPSFS